MPRVPYVYFQMPIGWSLLVKPIIVSYCVTGTLTHGAKTVCISPELFQREILHLREALGRYKYPGWAIQKVQSKEEGGPLASQDHKGGNLHQGKQSHP